MGDLFCQQHKLFLIDIQSSALESIINPIDQFFPSIFEEFWNWQESKIWNEDWNIFDDNFKIWLKHVKKLKKSEESKMLSFVPSNENECWEGKFAKFAQMIVQEWEPFWTHDFLVFCHDQMVVQKIRKKLSVFYKVERTSGKVCGSMAMFSI